MAGTRLGLGIRRCWSGSSSSTTRTGDLVAKRRGDHDRLGWALQLVTVRHVEAFLADPLDVPLVVLDYVAAQLGVADPSCVKRYTERTRPGWSISGRSLRWTAAPRSPRLRRAAVLKGYGPM
jgi:hypothetical protein